MGEPDHLQGFLERSGRVLGDPSADFGDLQQFLPALLIRAFRRLAFRLVRHSVGVGDQALALDDAGAPVVDLFFVQLALGHHGVDIGLALLHIALQADLQQRLVVAGRFAGYAVRQADGDDVVAHAFDGVGGQSRAGDILHRLAFPVGQVFQNGRAVFRGDVVRVLRADGEFIQFLQIELRAGLEFRVQVGAAVLVRGRADDQLVLHDERRHVLHDVVDDFGAEFGDVLSRELLVRLRRQHQALGRDAGAGVPQFISHFQKAVV